MRPTQKTYSKSKYIQKLNPSTVRLEYLMTDGNIC